MDGANASVRGERGVLVTGGCGFIGSNYTLEACSRNPGTTFVCLDRLDYCASMENLKDADGRRPPNLVFVHGDVANASLVRHLLRAYDIGTIVHFAAQSHVCNSFEEASTFVSTNVGGTAALCEEARHVQLERFVLISTDEVVGDGEEYKDETAPPENPNNPYAASKACAEIMAASYHRTWGVPVVTVRMCNVYGPRQFPEKVVARFCVRALTGRPLVIHGEGSCRRTYAFVEDVVDGLLRIAQNGIPGRVYHLAGAKEDELSAVGIADAVRYACIASGLASRPEVRHGPDRIYNDACYHISGDNAGALGWAPKTNFLDGVEKTLAWYAKHIDSRKHEWRRELVDA